MRRADPTNSGNGSRSNPLPTTFVAPWTGATALQPRAMRVRALSAVARRSLLPPALRTSRRGLATSPIDPAAAGPPAADALAAATAAPPTALGVWPPDLMLRLVDTVHETSGLPWWVAIGACTALARLVLLPIALNGSHQQAKMQAIRGELAPLQARVQQSGGTDAHAAAQMHALYEKYGVNPMRMIAMPLMQLPVFMSFFLGLRRLVDAFPQAHEGGAYWFVDLGAQDTTYILPVASGLSALLLVRISVPDPTKGMSLAEASQAVMMKNVLSGVTLVSLPVACTMPSSVLVFWLTNNAISLMYTTAMQATPVRGALGLPPMPPPRDPNEPDDPNGVAPAMPLEPVSDPSAVNRAQLLAAKSLSDLAESMAGAGKLPEAITMLKRAVAVREVAREALDGGGAGGGGAGGGDAAGEGDSSGHRAGAATDAQALRDSLWRLAELQEQAGEWAGASSTVERWRIAGGDEEFAASKREQLLQLRQEPEEAPEGEAEKEASK